MKVRSPVKQTLDLFPIGNCAASALIDREGRYVWACVPRVDGDPFFSTLLDGRDPAAADAQGLWDVTVERAVRIEQAYLRNTPVLRTVVTAEDGAAAEILDFCHATGAPGGPTARWPSCGCCGRLRARLASPSACGRHRTTARGAALRP